MSSVETGLPPGTSPTIPQLAIPPLGEAPEPAARPKRRFDVRRDAKLLLAIFGGVLVLNLAFWILLVRPRQGEIKTLELRKLSANLTEKEAGEQLTALRALHGKVTGNQQAIRTFYDEMLSTKRERLVPFQRAVAQVARDFDCEPERTAVSSTQLEDEGIESLALTFPITGGYENLRGFLADLESLQQFLIVREVTLSGAKEGGQDVQLNVAVETYFDAPGIREEKERERADKAKRRRQSGARRSAASRGAGR